MTELFFQDYLRTYQPYKPYWNYEDGCVLLGCIRMYHATGCTDYAEFVLDYLSERIAEDGSIMTYPVGQYALDSFHCSKALFFAADQTGDPRYEKAIRWQAAQLMQHPRTKSGMIWHKSIYPHQVWIDGVYMAAPFLAEYARRTGQSELYRELGEWFQFLRDRLRDPETGLYYHALDEEKQQPWADPETGRSASFWLRGEGWFLMALTDTLAHLPETESALREMLSELLRDAAESLLRYRSTGGLFCQVIDKPALSGNYTETSGSLMAAYALMRGAAMHLLPRSLFETGAAILRNVRSEKLCQTESGILLTDICGAAGLGGAAGRDGSAAYYLSESKAVNDPKGVGVLMSAEAAWMQAHRDHPQNAVCHA